MVEHDAIRALVGELIETWNRGDIHAFSALFTEDADYVTGSGRLCHGRQAIVRDLGAACRDGAQDAAVTITNTSIRLLRPDVAIVHCTWEMGAGRRGENPPAGRQGTMIQVLTRTDGRWKVVALQNTDVRRSKEPGA
jgi:uncharacterized protein (TIGR02246 family)